MRYGTKLFVIWGKLQRAHLTKSGHFATAYLGGINKLRASLEVSLLNIYREAKSFTHNNVTILYWGVQS